MNIEQLEYLLETLFRLYELEETEEENIYLLTDQEGIVNMKIKFDNNGNIISYGHDNEMIKF